MKHRCLTIILILVYTGITSAAIIHVPGDYPDIKSGMNAAQNGDTVLVADGTYTGRNNKNIEVVGKQFTLMSENGLEHCVIDGGFDGRFLRLSTIPQDTVIQGFTIRNMDAITDM